MGHTRLPKQRECRLEYAEGGVDVMSVRGQNRVPPAVVGTKQLVGTIEEVETHEPDPRSSESTDPWTRFHEEFGALGTRLRDTYRNVASENGPTEEEIKDALGTLAGAWNQVAGSVSSALQDTEVREKLKEAAGALAAALGRTISDLGSELRDRDTWEPTSTTDADKNDDAHGTQD
jgi:hypothetical protein